MQEGICLRGSEQIRTAVKGFADLCLATRPRNHKWGAKIKQSNQASKTNSKLANKF